MQGVSRGTSSRVRSHIDVPYFPPPPRSATMPRTKLKKRSPSAESIEFASIFAFNWKRRTALERSRVALLPALLLLSAVSLALSLIYAYCVSRYYRGSDVSQSSSDHNNRLLTRASTISTSPTWQSNSTVSVTAHSDSEKFSTAVLFYTLTTPTVTMLLLATELAIYCTTPTILSLRIAHNSLLVLYAFMIAGTSATATLWTHCELPSPLHTSHFAICPSEVRGHFMYGIHETSVARCILAWLVGVAGLALHWVCLWRERRRLKRRLWVSAKEVQADDEFVVGVHDDEDGDGKIANLGGSKRTQHEEFVKGMTRTRVRFL